MTENCWSENKLIVVSECTCTLIVVFVDMCVCTCAYVHTYIHTYIHVYVLTACLFISFRKQYLHGRNGQLEIQDQGAEYLDQCVDLTPSKYGTVD